MAIQVRVLTDVHLPEEIEVEITDTIRGQTVVRKVNFPQCIRELGSLGAVDLEEIPADRLIEMAFAVARHRAIDQYLRSIGVDPHEHLAKWGPVEESDMPI
jgi:hypothetical protein